MLSVDDLQAIEAVHRRWIAAENSGNPKAVLELCTDDVEWIPPTEPALKGKQAIDAWLDRPSVSIRDLRISNLRIDGSGSVAYKLAEFETTYVPTGAADAVTVRGTHLWVLHRIAGGSWRVAVATWNSHEPPKGAV